MVPRQAKAAATKDTPGSVTFSFFAVIVSEYLLASVKLTDDTLRPLVPHLLFGAKCKASVEYQVRVRRRGLPHPSLRGGRGRGAPPLLLLMWALVHGHG